MSNELRFSTILDRIQSHDTDPVIFQDDDGVLRINQLDELIERVDNAIAVAKTTAFTDDDRKSIRETRAFVSKFNKFVDRHVIDMKRNMFDPLEEDRKLVKSKMNELSDELKTTLEEFDAVQREKKRQELMVAFDDNLFVTADSLGHADTLRDLKYDQIENARWANRSTSMNSNIKDMVGRIKAVASVVESDDSINMDAAVNLLHEHEWDTAAVILEVQRLRREEEERLRLEREAEEKRQRELKEAEERGRQAALAEAQAVSEQTPDEPVEDSRDESDDDDAEMETIRYTAIVELNLTLPKGEKPNNYMMFDYIMKRLDNGVTTQGVRVETESVAEAK